MKRQERRDNQEVYRSLVLPTPVSLRDKILLTLLATGAVIETLWAEASTPITIGYALSSLESQEYFRRRRSSSRSTLSYLIAKKFILSRQAKGSRSFQLTEEGLDVLFKKFPTLKYYRCEWDGYWRVVVYDIAEEKSRLRDRLRHELRRLGFKFVQKSVWLTPLPVEKELETFLKGEKLWGKILVLKSLLPAEENKRLAALFGLFKVGHTIVDKKLNQLI